MNTAPYIERLAAQCDGFNFIGGAMDLNESTLQAASYPAAFVLPLGESAEPNPLIGSHIQQLRQQWGVLITLKAMRTVGQDQSAELDALRQSVRTALLGWAPDAEGAPLEFTAGQLLGIEAGVLLWQDDYTTTRYLQGA